MTDQTPIERAGKAVYKTGPGYDLTGGKPWEELSTSSQDNAMRNARAAFESIDTNQLADVLSTLTTCDGQPHASELHHRQARAVKNWLTGKDQP